MILQNEVVHTISLSINQSIRALFDAILGMKNGVQFYHGFLVSLLVDNHAFFSFSKLYKKSIEIHAFQDLESVQITHESNRID